MSVIVRRGGISRLLELTAGAALIATLAYGYLTITQSGEAGSLLTPGKVAILLVATLVPAMALMVLAARRLAIRRAAHRDAGLRSRLPVRLVAIFSVIASVPTLLVVIFASMLFQYGVEFWFSDRARNMLENAARLAQENYEREIERVNDETVTMSGDLAGYLQEIPIDNPQFAELFGRQVFVRNLSESVIITVGNDGEIRSHALVNPYDRDLGRAVTPQMIAAVRDRRRSIAVPSADRIGALTPMPGNRDTFVYAARVFEPELASQLQRGAAILDDYRTLAGRTRSLQLQFNAALLGLSLLIVGIAIWIALKMADRMVRPVGQLVNAARQITAGDLSVRVPAMPVKDEIATLGNAFNRMTRRLEEQTGALVAANAQLDSRRAFTEAVLSGVTAGVISVDDDHAVRLINSSAEALLNTGGQGAVGRKLADLAPELDRQLTAAEREDVVQLTSSGEPRTLAVKTVKVKGGHVLTFDDITEQLMDQRRAAWSDVARRIAHEIKNPLTPIQLAAERLQRRYGKEVTTDPSTFERLTGTIVRQVGDLRRMVDEFSSFARMPKPTFREEPLAEIAREALFLHEVAHPEIAFSLDVPDPSPRVVCDRRQLGQALTNIVKNGVEAIEQKQTERSSRRAAAGGDKVAMAIHEQGGRILIEITDTGIGLPVERGRLTEPYMTTRAKGTGLGLAIVKKIVEDHFGQIEFEDVSGGGSMVRMVLDPNLLAQLADPERRSEEESAND